MVDFRGTILAMLERSQLLDRIRRALKRSRVVALIGPRQSGKTTLARTLLPNDSINYFDLEDGRLAIGVPEALVLADHAAMWKVNSASTLRIASSCVSGRSKILGWVAIRR